MQQSKPIRSARLSMAAIDDDSDEFDVDFTTRSGPQLITFMLGQEKYGVDILRTRELITYPVGGVTPVPGLPGFVVGVINLRGLVIPVMDLRIRFRLAQAEYDGYTVIIIVEVEGKHIGLVIDSVSDVIHLEEDQIQSMEHLTASVDTEFIGGVVSIKDEMVIVLDVEHLLSGRELLALVDTIEGTENA